MHRRAKAWSVWLTVAIALAIAVTSAVWLVRHRRAHAPRTDASLHLPIADLRSHAEEARLLVRVARDGDTNTFTRQHARQLAKRVHSALDELPPPEKLLAKAAEAGAKASAAARPASAPRVGFPSATPTKTDAAVDSPAAYTAAANDARRARRAGDTLERALRRIGDAERPAAELDAVDPIFAAAARELGFLDGATQEPK